METSLICKIQMSKAKNLFKILTKNTIKERNVSIQKLFNKLYIILLKVYSILLKIKKEFLNYINKNY